MIRIGNVQKYNNITYFDSIAYYAAYGLAFLIVLLILQCLSNDMNKNITMWFVIFYVFVVITRLYCNYSKDDLTAYLCVISHALQCAFVYGLIFEVLVIYHREIFDACKT